MSPISARRHLIHLYINIIVQVQHYSYLIWKHEDWSSQSLWQVTFAISGNRNSDGTSKEMILAGRPKQGNSGTETDRLTTRATPVLYLLQDLYFVEYEMCDKGGVLILRKTY